MANGYYDPGTWASVDPSKVGYVESYNPDNFTSFKRYYDKASLGQYADDFGNPTDRNFLRVNYDDLYATPSTEYKFGDVNADFLSQYGGTGTTQNFLKSLMGQGYNASDLDGALRSYFDQPNHGRYVDKGWLGDQALIRAFGTGLDAQGKSTDWQSLYNADLERQQQAVMHDMLTHDNGNDWDDISKMIAGLSIVVGGAGLAGAFGGAAAAGGGAGSFASPLAGVGSFEAGAALPAFGAGEGIASGLAAGSGSVLGGAGSFNAGLVGGGLGGIAGAGAGTALGSYGLSGAGSTGGVGSFDAGNFVGTGSGEGGAALDSGGNMDWLDELINSTGTGTGSATSGDPLAGLFDGTGIGPSPLDVPGGLDMVNPGGTNGGQGLWDTIKGNLSNVPSGTQNLIKSLLGGGSSGTGSGTNLGSLLGPLLGAYASNQQSNALAELANKYQEYGAPYRAELANLTSNPGSFLTSPRVTASVDQGTSALARALSAKDGNPVGSGRALQEMQNYATNGLYSQLSNRENQLANFGGLSNFNAAAPSANLASVNQTGNMYNAIGAGINDVFNPQPTYLDLIKAMKGLA